MAENRIVKIDLGLSRIDIRDLTETAQLWLETGKPLGGGIRSNVTVYWVRGIGRSRTLGVDGDLGFMVKYDAAARATQKNIDRQHASIFTPEYVDSITERAIAHYENAKGVTRTLVA